MNFRHIFGSFLLLMKRWPPPSSAERSYDSTHHVSRQNSRITWTIPYFLTGFQKNRSYLIFLGYYWILFPLPKSRMAGWVKDLEQISLLCMPDVLRNWFTHCKQNYCSWLKHWIQSDEECQKESTNETPRWQFHCWLRGWGNGLMLECCDMSVQEKDVKTWTLVLLNQRRSGLWPSYQNGLCTWINEGTLSVAVQ